MPNIIATRQTTTKSFQSQRFQNPKLMIYKVLEYFKFCIFKYNGLLNLYMYQCEGHGLWAVKSSAMTMMPTPDCLSYTWCNHSNIPCRIRVISKLNRHLAEQRTVVWFRNAAAGSTGESSPVRRLWKLAGVTLICHEVLQLWQARRIALMDVLESVGQWLSLTGGPVWVR